MRSSCLLKKLNAWVLLLAAAWAISIPVAVRAQTANNDPAELKRKIAVLVKQGDHIAALPLLEKIVVLEPADHEMHFQLGMALMAQTTVTQDADERKALRIRAREAFIKAQKTGDQHPIVDALIGGIPPDGTEAPGFSENKAAKELMEQGEAFFSQGKLDEALDDYQKALVLDPKLYDAALFSGDVFIHREDWAQAEIWYQKAIAIDPNREIAYRYSATPFLKQHKYEQARDRYIEAYITEPYSRFARAGIQQWGDVTKTKLGHPKVDIPSNVKFDEKGNANINLDMSTLLGGKDDGSFAWLGYGGTRSLWHKEKFANAFPAEKTYRHSLKEEVDALQTVIHIATSDKKVKKLSLSLAKLKELNDKGLLEAFVLLATPDEGIAADHPGYLAQNRDKLRRYVVEYVVTNGGK
jgi:tetratricopeptide (TPR) repeat protein